MSQKRTASEAKLDEPSASTSRREMQGAGGDGKLHSLDSDEEDDYVAQSRNYELLADDDIEGQEDETIQRDGEISITPFNLKEEQEEGHFAKDGNFIWNKADKEIKDAWLDNIDWVKLKDTKKEEIEKREEDDEREDEAEAMYDELKAYKEILGFLKPGETVAKAIRRMAGGDMGKKRQQMQRKLQQKLKKGQALSKEEEQLKEDTEAMTKLTGFADLVLSRSGNMGIYEETYEKVAYRIKVAGDKKSKTVIPEGVDEDDALDMFADNFDAEKAAKKKEEEKIPEKEPEDEGETFNLDDVVKWEFRWENAEGAEVHGPHTSEEMLKWQQTGFFDKGVFVRKIGRESDFIDGRRIDFDLYT